MTKNGKHSTAMVTHREPLGRKQEGAAPLTPRRADGACGRCGGLLAYDKDLEGDKCSSYGRLGGPPAETPESVRARVYAELSTMAEGLDPVTFWQSFVLVNEVAAIIGMNSKMFRQWARQNQFEIVEKRNPVTGKRAAFLEVETAKAIIRFRM